MSGGRGSRMKTQLEKLLLNYKKPIIMRVISAMKESGCFSRVIAVTSRNSPKTRQFLINSGVDAIDTSGYGYVEDLNSVLCSMEETVFVTPGDLPLLDASVIKKIIEKTDPKNTWTTILLSRKYLELQNLKSDYCTNINNKQYFYSGISLVNPQKIDGLSTVKENYVIFDDKRIAFNLNTTGDYNLLCAS